MGELIAVLLDFLSTIIAWGRAFWEGDEEFPPSAQILYSDNFQFGFHAEDMVVAGDLNHNCENALCIVQTV